MYDSTAVENEEGNEKNVIVPMHKHAKHATHDLDAGLAQAFELLVGYLGRNNDLTEAEKANYADTAVRAAKAFRDLTITRTDIVKELQAILSTGFPKDFTPGNPRPSMIIQGPITAYSLCPHHLLAVEYEAYVAYQPLEDGDVLGLSKLARITEVLARRPVLQEQLACDIADVLCAPEHGGLLPGIRSDGSAVMLTGRHSCMSCRGVRSHALTSVTEVRCPKFDQVTFETRFVEKVHHISNSALRR